MPAIPATWDIFCTVVDNYGDAGVTWRLARQLAAEYRLAVRLWVDDLAVLQRLVPALELREAQRIAGVEVRRWPRVFPAVEPAEVVIEAFACELPEPYLEAMAARNPAPVWVNLEYLSAEDWVAGCHGLPSPQPRGLTKYFYFPGFAAGTGGLLREQWLPAARQRFQADPVQAAAFLGALGVQPPAGALRLSLFAYENPAAVELLSALSRRARPVWCLVPEGRVLGAVREFFAAGAPAPGERLQRDALTVAVLPFLAQDDYDRLLWSCDLNCVRGEDSFLRAQWAARPLLWHIYPQSDAAHLVKLEAFLSLYTRDLAPAAADALAAAWRAWNGAGDFAAAWPALERALPVLSAHAPAWTEQREKAQNLAAGLVQFCANQV